MSRTRFFAILGFIFIGLSSRFLPHPPNFTAINAIALFGAGTIGSLPLSLATVFSAMFISDLAFGFHQNMFLVYSSFGLTVLMGHFLNKNRTFFNTTACLTASSVLFFVITNFGEWLNNPIYLKTFEGLVTCYIAALPFLSLEMIGTLFYGWVIFSSYSYVEKHYFSFQN